MAWELWVGGGGEGMGWAFFGSWCWLSGGVGGIILDAVCGELRGCDLGSFSMRWSSPGGCVLLHLWMGCIRLGLGVAVGMVFSVAGGLLASFLILGMSWIGGGVFVFSLEFFMGAGTFCQLSCCTGGGLLGRI